MSIQVYTQIDHYKQKINIRFSKKRWWGKAVSLQKVQSSHPPLRCRSTAWKGRAQEIGMTFAPEQLRTQSNLCGFLTSLGELSESLIPVCLDLPQKDLPICRSLFNSFHLGSFSLSCSLQICHLDPKWDQLALQVNFSLGVGGAVFGADRRLPCVCSLA